MRLGEMCRSFVVIMQTFKSQSGKSTCIHYPVDNKWCLANYMIALKIYYTIWVHGFIFVSKCNLKYFCLPELRGDSIFSYQISICKVYTTKPFFSGPILCKLGTNQPFVKWISVSLNKASHSNRNYSKVQNKRGRGLKLVLDQRYCTQVILGFSIVQHFFFLWYFEGKGGEVYKINMGLWTVFVWFYIMVGLSLFCFFCFMKMYMCTIFSKIFSVI